MPIYEFACKNCRTAFERFVLSSRSFNDVKCPKCGSKDVQKMMSSFSCGSSFSNFGLSGGGGFGSAPSGGGCGSPGGFS